MIHVRVVREKNINNVVVNKLAKPYNKGKTRVFLFAENSPK